MPQPVKNGSATAVSGSPAISALTKPIDVVRLARASSRSIRAASIASAATSAIGELEATAAACAERPPWCCLVTLAKSSTKPMAPKPSVTTSTAQT